MRRLPIAPLSLALAAGLAGCAPMLHPHAQRTQPEVDGRLPVSRLTPPEGDRA